MGNRPHILEFFRSKRSEMEQFNTQGEEKYIDKAMALAIKKDFGLCLHELLLMDDQNPWCRDIWIPLEMAVKCGSILSVKVLLCHMPRGLSKSPKSQHILLCALENHELGMINVLLDYGWPTEHSSSKISPLHWAIQNNELVIVELLLKKSADPNFANPDNRQLPLMVAVDRGSETMVKLLIQYDANPLIVDDGFRSPLSRAVDENKSNLVAAMLERIRDTREKSATFKLVSMVAIPPHNGTTLFLTAIERGNTDIVRMFLDAGADPNAIYRMLDSPLNTAIRMGALDLIEILLQKGADPTLKTQVSGGPFHVLSYCRAEVAKTRNPKRKHDEMEGPLLSTEVEIEAAAAPGTAVREKVWTFLKIAKLLHHSKAEIDAFDFTGTTPLIRAILCNNMQYASLLVNLKASPNKRDRIGMTPAHYAAFWGSRILMKKLIKAGMSLIIPDRLNRKPIYWAGLGATSDDLYESATGKFDAIFDALAETNKRYHAESALTAVLKAGSKELFQKIIRIDGLDLNIPDRHGWTALDVASMSSTLTEEAETLRGMKAINGDRIKEPTTLSPYDLLPNIQVLSVDRGTQAWVDGKQSLHIDCYLFRVQYTPVHTY